MNLTLQIFHSFDDERRSSRSCSLLDHKENKQRWCAGCINLCWKWFQDCLRHPERKHPDPPKSSIHSFLPCSELPPLLDVDLTSSHIEKVAQQIQGSAGPGGFTASHWKDSLLHYGAHSAKLRDALAELARCLACQHNCGVVRY